MAVYPFSFTVIVHEEYDEKTNTNFYRRESGMSLASSYSHAMKILEDYYDMDLISVKHLELFEENNIILLPESCIKEYAKSVDNIVGIPCDVDGDPVKTVSRVIVEKGNNIYEC